jgi:hypothetical protein
LRREDEHFGHRRQRPAAVLDQAQREVGARNAAELLCRVLSQSRTA